MATRNFWIDTKIDGRKENLTGGPRRKEDGFSQEIWVRVDGSPVLAWEITGLCKTDGTLRLELLDKRAGGHNPIHSMEVNR